MQNKRPVIGISSCIKMLGEHPFHAAGAKYVDAIVNAADCVPVLLPAIGDKQDLDTILQLVDGVLLTGSVSNVAPERYQQSLIRPDVLQDHARDATTFPLIQALLAANKPLLGICRGFQELNVAMGGSLYQVVHAQAHLMDHREKPESDLETQYGPAHSVKLSQGGYLQHLLSGANEIMVNSIHGQGVQKLGLNLAVEAVAPDGLVEAIRVENAKNFALAVQWHPEWKVLENAQSRLIFKAFGDACRSSFR